MKELMTASVKMATELTLKQWNKEQDGNPFKPWKGRAPSVLGDLGKSMLGRVYPLEIEPRGNG